MRNMLAGLEELTRGLLLPLLLGVVACLVRLTRYGWRSWKNFLGSCAVSCFTAVMVFWGLDYADFPPTVDAAIIGVASYMGGMLLDAVTFRVRHEIKYGEKPEFNPNYHPGRRKTDNGPATGNEREENDFNEHR